MEVRFIGPTTFLKMLLQTTNSTAHCSVWHTAVCGTLQFSTLQYIELQCVAVYCIVCSVQCSQTKQSPVPDFSHNQPIKHKVNICFDASQGILALFGNELANKILKKLPFATGLALWLSIPNSGLRTQCWAFVTYLPGQSLHNSAIHTV